MTSTSQVHDVSPLCRCSAERTYCVLVMISTLSSLIAIFFLCSGALVGNVCSHEYQLFFRLV